MHMAPFKSLTISSFTYLFGQQNVKICNGNVVDNVVKSNDQSVMKSIRDKGKSIVNEGSSQINLTFVIEPKTPKRNQNWIYETKKSLWVELEVSRCLGEDKLVTYV